MHDRFDDFLQTELATIKQEGLFKPERVISMLQSGLDVSPVITHRFPVADFQQAFKIMSSGQSGKVILDWE